MRQPLQNASEAVAASNEDYQLQPKTDFGGPALEFDFPGVKIGIAEYEEGATGCTVRWRGPLRSVQPDHEGDLSESR